MHILFVYVVSCFDSRIYKRISEIYHKHILVLCLFLYFYIFSYDKNNQVPNSLFAEFIIFALIPNSPHGVLTCYRTGGRRGGGRD